MRVARRLRSIKATVECDVGARRLLHDSTRNLLCRQGDKRKARLQTDVAPSQKIGDHQRRRRLSHALYTKGVDTSRNTTCLSSFSVCAAGASDFLGIGMHACTKDVEH